MNIKAYGISLYKKENNTTKILLCKAADSKKKWGFLKGVRLKGENDFQTAIREFKEESGIKVEKRFLEHYFEQINTKKDIGVYLVNYDNIHGIEKYFTGDSLGKKYLSWENSEAKFFEIKNLPKIKNNQNTLVQDIVTYLKGS